MTGNRRVRDVIGYAAKGGVAMGLYLTLVSSCMVASLYVTELAMAGMVLLCGVPVVLWRFMRGMTSEAEGRNGFGSLWLGGIYCFIFGSLICGLLTAVYLVIAEPSFMSQYIKKGIESWEEAGRPSGMLQQIEVLQRALERKMIPNSMEMVVSMICSTAFFGSVLSAAEALVLSGRRRMG